MCEITPKNLQDHRWASVTYFFEIGLVQLGHAYNQVLSSLDMPFLLFLVR